MDRGAASDPDPGDTGRGLASVRHQIAPKTVFRKTPPARYRSVPRMQGIYPDRERAQAMANVRIGAAVAGIAAAAVAGTFIDVLPASWVFAAAALIGLPGAIAFFWVRYDGSAKPATRRSLPEIAQGVWADHKYRRLLLSFTLFGMGNLMNVAVYPVLLVDHFHAAHSFIGGVAGGGSLWVVAGGS